MARPYRIQFEGARYHVSACGVPRRKLFRSAADFRRMVGMIEESAEKRGVLVHAYCLLDNRLELIVETPRGNLSQFQQGYQTGYSSYYRKKYNVGGTLFQDRFKSKLLMVKGGDRLLLLASRHVHLLPARASKYKSANGAKKVKAAAAWEWSSLPALLKRDAQSFVTDEVLRAVGGRVLERPKRLRTFLAEAIAERDDAYEEIYASSQVALGDDAFVAEVERMHKRYRSGRKPSDWNEYGKAPKKRVSKKKIEDAVCKVLGKPRAEVMKRRKGSLDRPILSWTLYEFGGMTQEAIAKHLGLSAGATVGQHSKRVRDAAKTDKKVAKILKELRAKLGS